MTVNKITALIMWFAFSGMVTADQQNVLWINIDDQSPWYGAYGDQIVQTPNIDALASEGVLFERAYAPSPVCSPSRSTIITGSYAIRIGAHDQRSGRVSGYQIHLPDGVQTVPELFLAAGYETYNAGKDDFNFSYERSSLYSIGEFDETFDNKNWKGDKGSGDWRDVPDGAAFFGQVPVSGGKIVNENTTGKLKQLGYTPVDQTDVSVPGQYPDVLEVRQHIANHYNSIMQTDYELGLLVERLKRDGLWQNTIVFFFSDHGSDLPRSKEFLYHEGLHVPLIIVAPGLSEIVKPGVRRAGPVNLMDVAATSLTLAGLPVPEFMDAQNLFANDYSREFVFSSADRMSNVIDRVRSVMGARYHYIRNYKTDRPLMNWGYREMWGLQDASRFSSITVRRLFEAGQLTPTQAAPYGKRVSEELYDLDKDPSELVNLAASADHRAQLNLMRRVLADWVAETDDKGQYPRSKAALKEITDRYPSEWLKSPEFQ